MVMWGAVTDYLRGLGRPRPKPRLCLECGAEVLSPEHLLCERCLSRDTARL